MNFSWDSVMPIVGTDAAQAWEHLHLFLLLVCAFFFVIVIGPMIFFAFRFRKRPGRKPRYITHNFALEVTWTLIPTLTLMVIFTWGWIVYQKMVYAVPDNFVEVRVVAKSWSWTFQYDDGRTTTNELYVPVNRPIKLVMTSDVNDVLHSFFVPNFRIKKDAVPGMYTTVWFTPRVIGQHQIFCAEYCGAGHSEMLAKLIVLEQKDYQLWRWGKEINIPPAVGVGGMDLVRGMMTEARVLPGAQVAEAGEKGSDFTSLVEQGEKLSRSRGCIACHSSTDAPSIGPSYVGLFGSEVQLADGSTVIADENYIRESIENPQAKIVKGYEQVIMPPYPGALSELELNALIAYIKSLK